MLIIESWGLGGVQASVLRARSTSVILVNQKTKDTTVG